MQYYSSKEKYKEKVGTNNLKEKITQPNIEELATYNHQAQVEHVEKTVATFNAMFERLFASKNIGE